MQAFAMSSLARGFELLSTSHFEAALTAFNTAQDLGADADECSGGRWRSFMLLGEMEAAWKETDAIRSRGNPDPHRFWDGSSLEGKRLIVRCLHGYGDTIQMIRFIPKLLSVARCVILEVQPRLVPLLRSLPFLKRESLEIITWGDDAPATPPRWDIQIEIMEVPYVLRTTRAELPVNTRYLEVSESEITKTFEEMGQSLLPRVGLVWTAGEWNPDRAMPFQQMRRLLRAPVEFWSLVDSGDYAKVLASDATCPMRDSSGLGEGIAGLRTVISALSLVITTDTLAAHLAGAMGVPVWVLLPYSADWRWMRGDRSPWYPSMELFRQERPGNWEEVIGGVETALRTELLKGLSPWGSVSSQR